MLSEDDLKSAVEAGVLSTQTAAALREHAAQRQQSAALDDEQIRLVSGFNDVFVVIACLLLLVSVRWIVGSVASSPVGGLAMSATAWVLAEFFVRQRRMGLPAIVLLLAFVGGVVSGLPALIGAGNTGLGITGVVAAAAMAAHWWRFKVPITIAAGSAAIGAGVIALIVAKVPGAEPALVPLLFALGVAIFLQAMIWDAADTRRLTRRADVAFWLHLLAAPLLVHPVFSVLHVSSGDIRLAQAAAVIALYVLIALVSLAIDRRALMVSALAYVLYTFSALLKQHGAVSLGFALTALAIGIALLLLSAFWHRSRAQVLRRLPRALASRLPVSR